MEHCSLCQSGSISDFKTSELKLYHHCHECDLRFLSPSFRLSPRQERDRYELHENNSEDSSYQAFVQPLIRLIARYRSEPAETLDYGCGKDSALSHLLRRSGHRVHTYDPYFFPRTETLQRRYDLIVACEVIEHFYKPYEEFFRLRKMLSPGALLAVKSHFYDRNTDFESWYYRRDPTHVSFYSRQSLRKIQQVFTLSRLLYVDNRQAIWMA